VNHASGVCGSERAANLRDNPHCLFRRKFSSFTEHGAKVAALDELHGDELETLGLSQVENANDVPVGNFASEDQLLFEAAKDFRITGEVRANQLESNEAFELRVARLVNGAHSALAEQREDFVAIGQQCPDKLLSLGVGGVRRRNDGDRPCGSAAGSGACRWRAARKGSVECLVIQW
jgi:hypothetical protein